MHDGRIHPLRVYKAPLQKPRSLAQSYTYIHMVGAFDKHRISWLLKYMVQGGGGGGKEGERTRGGRQRKDGEEGMEGRKG